MFVSPFSKEFGNGQFFMLFCDFQKPDFSKKIRFFCIAERTKSKLTA